MELITDTKIPIKKTTRKELLELAQKGETYDDFINKMIDVYKGAIKNAVR